MNSSHRHKDGRKSMRLDELVGVIEPSQEVVVYEVGRDGFSYQGMAAHVPSAIGAMQVQAVQAYEWEIDILVSEAMA